MQRFARSIALLTAFACFAAACSKVPITGRRQLNIIPESIMTGLGKSSYKQTLSNKSIERDGKDVDVLKKVGGRISKVANRPDYEWRYALINDKQINAWCLPGGYIGFYTGILPVLENEAAMAFVMGHEVGHAVARHGSERLSQQLVLVGGLTGLAILADAKTDMTKEQTAIVFGALGVGAEVGILLPFSRAHESEADIIGMMYAASAGYPPGEGIALWDRMEASSKGVKLPAFVSTHPSNDKRQANMREWMPRAKKRFERNKLDYDTKKELWGSTASR